MALSYYTRSNNQLNEYILYEFSLGVVTPRGNIDYSVKSWRYTSEEVNVVYDGNVYYTLSIGNSGASITNEQQSNQFTITLPLSSEIGQIYNEDPPSSIMRVTVRRRQYGDKEAPIAWMGVVSTCSRTSDAEIKLSCSDFGTMISGKENRCNWSRQCTHALYDNLCRVNKESFKKKITIETVNHNTITSLDLLLVDNGYFSGGFIEWERWPNVYDRRGIDSHEANSIVMIGSTNSLNVGDIIYAYPGCDRSTGDGGCNKFDNISNFGGFPFIPGKSPFEGENIFV